MSGRPPIGLSLHIGINRLDFAHYGTTGTLTGCENDATSMQELAVNAGFTPSRLLTTEATAEAVLGAIRGAASQLEAGDLFLLTYSGHGGQLKDLNGDEEGGRDSTWCLYDRMVVDDELWEAWRAFRAGVRILVVADSCHSGTSVREVLPGEIVGPDERDPTTLFKVGTAVRTLSAAQVREAFGRNEALYNEVLGTVRGTGSAPVAATVLLLAACQDNQTASDGDDRTNFNGLFTHHLLQSLTKKPADYRALHKLVLAPMPANQSPNLYIVGTPSPAFEADRPFSIGTVAAVDRPVGAGLSGATTTGANFRRTPAVSSGNVIRQLATGTRVVVVGNDGEWLQAKVGEELGYLHMSVVAPADGAQGGWTTTATTGVNVRSSPSASATYRGTIAAGQEAVVTGWDRNVPWLTVTAGQLSGWVKASYARGLVLPPTGGDGPLEPAAIRALRAEIDAGDPALRATRFEALQRRVIYRSQRDNQARLGGARVETPSGNMCNLTSLAMALSVLGIDNPKPAVQYEDALEEIRQANGFAARTTAQGWGAVARAVGADVQFIRGGDFCEGRAWWFANVRTALAAGKGVMMSITGHIVRVEAVTDAGVVVDDPYGRCELLAGTGRTWIQRNPYDAPGAVGDSVTFPWAQVEAHTMHWIAAFTRASRDLVPFLEPLPVLADDQASDPTQV